MNGSQDGRDSGGLLRALGPLDTAAMVVGTVIGTGVFLKTAVMAQQVGTPSLVLAAWVVGGLLSLAGALTYAELGSMMPQAGGEYVFLRSAYGRAAAFLYGWMTFVVAAGGSTAALGVAFSSFLSALIPLGDPWIQTTYSFLGPEITWQFGVAQLVAVGLILFFSGLNCLGVALGGRVQTVVTTAKAGSLLAIAFGVYLFSEGASWDHLATPAGSASWTGPAAFGAAMLGVFWAYNGWNTLAMLAGEVRDPERNIPVGLIGGMSIILILYLMANLAYFYALPFSEILTSNSTAYPNAAPVASKAVQSFLGPSGTAFVTIAFLISVVGALNGTIMTFSRVPFAMAYDGLFFSRIARVSSRYRVPVWAIGIQALWGSVLALSGTFDQLTDFAVFGLWIFYGLAASALFVFRRRGLAGSYRVASWIPVVFILSATFLVGNTIYTRPLESLVGLGLIGAGLPLYLWVFRPRRNA